MPERINIIQANIDNLISLWQKAAKPFNGCFSSDDYHYCYIENSEWPNRLWFGEKISESSINAAKKQNCSTLKNLIVPYWDIYTGTSYQILEETGFKEKSMQIGMSLKLGNVVAKPLRLKFEKILNADRAMVWANLYPRAFGYKISEQIPAKSHQDIEFYLVSHLERPVGTAIVYRTEDVVGVHGLGVIPESRNQGFAEEIMGFVLNRAISLGASYVVLQSSAMGKGLYDKLGFKEDFIIKNYTLNNDC